MDNVWSWIVAHWVVILCVYLIMGIIVTACLSHAIVSIGRDTFVGWLSARVLCTVLWLPVIVMIIRTALKEKLHPSATPYPEPHPSQSHDRVTGRARYFERPPDPPSVA